MGHVDAPGLDQAQRAALLEHRPGFRGMVGIFLPVRGRNRQKKTGMIALSFSSLHEGAKSTMWQGSHLQY